MKSLLPFAGTFFAIFILSNGFPSDDHAYEHELERRMHPGVYRSPNRQADEYEKKEHWFQHARDALQAKLKDPKIEKQAKNIIFFLGDGMSVPTVTAARIFKGQKDDSVKYGEEASLHFDSFPNIGVSKTFCADSQTADSACSATAYLCGTKANDATIGVSPDVKFGNCASQMNETNHVSSILAWSQAAEKSTGVVTTARVTHASPAGAYAHIAARDWEDDSYIMRSGVDPETCDDIAEQLIRKSPGKDINVIFGGGRWRFIPNTTIDSEGGRGYRQDGIDLIDEWKSQHNTPRSSYIENIEQLEALNPAETDFVLGLFSGSHVAYLDKQAEDKDPSLEAMTKKAIEILSKNEKGYFLFVEGGRIDHAHHDTNAQRALWETIEFDKAIKLADEMTSADDTIILVTSDHAHVMSLAGYPPRGNPLLKEAGTADDGLPYPTLSYANGPGHKNHTMTEDGCRRFNISTQDMEHIDYLQPTTAIINSETHGGDDVLIFSRGPYAHLLTGVQQQSYIPHALAYAACIGDGPKCCDTGCTRDSGSGSSAPQSLFISFYLLLTVGTYHILKNI